MTKLRSLELAIEALENMHGSVTGDGEHEAEASECSCEQGQAIEVLLTMENSV